MVFVAPSTEEVDEVATGEGQPDGSGSVRADSRADSQYPVDRLNQCSLEHDRIMSWYFTMNIQTVLASCVLLSLVLAFYWGNA
jgi:hypothetical protein